MKAALVAILIGFHCLSSLDGYISFFRIPFNAWNQKHLLKKSTWRSSQRQVDEETGLSTGSDETLNSTAPLDLSFPSTNDSSGYDSIRPYTSSRNMSRVWGRTKSGQEFYRIYPFPHLGLQILYDNNNYYSGTYGNIFWQQNADQVLIHYPLNDSIVKSDIECHFDYLLCEIKIANQRVFTFKPFEKVWPDGCFWTIELDKDNNRYLTIDLDKRLKFSNWRGLFRDISDNEFDNLDLRSKLLMKLHHLKQQGKLEDKYLRFKTLEEMLDDEELVNLLLDEMDKEEKHKIEERNKVYEMIGANKQKDPEGMHPMDAAMMQRAWKKQQETGSNLTYVDEEGYEGEEDENVPLPEKPLTEEEERDLEERMERRAKELFEAGDEPFSPENVAAAAAAADDLPSSATENNLESLLAEEKLEKEKEPSIH
jgi:hypothetical protein